MIGYGLARVRTDPWPPRRSAVARAIERGDYRILAERRSHTRY
jgi:hypothetical protein